MSGVHLEKGDVQGIQKHCLNDPIFLSHLEKSYCSFLLINFGPKNGLTLIQNSTSNITLTSSSSTYLPQTSFSHPCFKFINELIKAQHEIHGVYAAFVGLLCSNLLYRFIRLEERLSHPLIINISEWICKNLLPILSKGFSSIACNIDIGKIEDVLCVVKAILGSKYFPGITAEDNRHIAIKIVEAFLKTVPENHNEEFGRVLIWTQDEGLNISDSYVENGLLYSVNDSMVSDLVSNSDSWLKSDELRIVVFTVPLDSDVKEFSLIEWQNLETNCESSLVDYYFDLLMDFLTKNRISILANQKYIHSTLKFKLLKKGILVLERLGSLPVKHLLDMTCSCPLTSISQVRGNLTQEFLGRVSSVSLKELNGKVYVNVLPLSCRRDVTFVLMGKNPHITSYLKETIDSCISLLQKLLLDPKVLPGSGCLETIVCGLLIKLRVDSVHLADTFETSSSKVSQVFGVFVDTFLRLAIATAGGAHAVLSDYSIDSSTCHLWNTPERVSDDIDDDGLCACKSINKSDLPADSKFVPLNCFRNMDTHPEVFLEYEAIFSKFDFDNSKYKLNKNSIVDVYSAKVNALHVAFNGFSEMFDIGMFIYD